MYRIVDGVKTPYNVLSAREALESSFNDAEREEFYKIIASIRFTMRNHETGYVWYYNSKDYWKTSGKIDDRKIVSLLKFYGYKVGKRSVTEGDFYAYPIYWVDVKED